MSRRTRLLPPIALLLLLPFLLAVAQPQGRNGPLVSTAWLAHNLDNPGVLLLDASINRQYAAKHIPGAINVDMYVYGIGAQPQLTTQLLYQSWGVDAKKTIVLYDAGANIMATRAFWSLVYASFPLKNLAILDGGLAKWEADGHAVTKDSSHTPARGSFKIAKFDESVRVRLPDVLTATGDSNTALVEGLDGTWHFGQITPFARAGHIPNGVLLPAGDFYNADKTFKSPDEIRRMLRVLNIRPEQTVYTYCGGGVAASVPFFALKYLVGYPNVKMFAESELGWLADERELPYWTYDAPFLMRRTPWLRQWTSPMLRLYLDTKVSVVDVRSPDAFAQGHVAFAVNIPADSFRANAATPEKLATTLGVAGVPVSHEVVVVSGAGVTKEAALAFALVSQTGQKRVSIFLDPVEQWAPGGLTVTQTATNPAAAMRVATVADAKRSADFPRVYIASGASLPARALDGKVVHVPFSDLLNADGTPKAAKEIWATLTKAGVPRYAELVTVSDDPGEAAVNYYILKLMGYPDVRMQL